MRCPVCDIDNPKGAVRCSSCSGTLSPSGVDYSRLSLNVDWQDYSRLSKEEDVEEETDFGSYPFMLLELLLYLTVSGLLSSNMLYTGHQEGDDGMMMVGYVMLALFAVLLFALWRLIKLMYSEPDLDIEPLSVQDMDKLHFDRTGLLPKR